MPKKSSKKAEKTEFDCPRCQEKVKRRKKLGKHYELGTCGCGSDWYRVVVQGARGRWWPGLPGIEKERRKRAS